MLDDESTARPAASLPFAFLIGHGVRRRCDRARWIAVRPLEWNDVFFLRQIPSPKLNSIATSRGNRIFSSAWAFMS
jgi:hypothetical protein